MRKNILLLNKILILCVLFCLSLIIYGEIGVVKNPKPNMFEKEYIELKEVRTIGADLGNGKYLFKPFSLSIDKDNNLYIYDILQAKIIKLDRDFKYVTSFGRKGQRPGEFSGEGTSHPVFINIGLDGNLYANDIRSRRIIAFTTDGKYIREQMCKAVFFSKPVVDEKGNIHLIRVNDEKEVEIFNEKGKRIFSLGNRKSDFDYLVSKPGPIYRNLISRDLSRNVLYLLTKKHKNLIYILQNSCMYIYNSKQIKKYRILPDKALRMYKEKLIKLKKKEGVFIYLFLNIILDRDDQSFFYLYFGIDKKNKRNLIYKFNLSGKLEKVFYFKYNYVSSFEFEIKKNNYFFVIKDDKISLLSIK